MIAMYKGIKGNLLQKALVLRLMGLPLLIPVTRRAQRSKSTSRRVTAFSQTIRLSAASKGN